MGCLVLITANSCKYDNLIIFQCNFVIVAIFKINNFFIFSKIPIFAMAVHYDFVFLVDSET